MGIKINFDINKLKKQIMNEVERHPERLMEDHIGETVEASCPKCNNPKMKIIHNGKMRCPKCSAVVNINYKVEWR